MSGSQQFDDNTSCGNRQDDEYGSLAASCHLDDDGFAEVGAQVARELGPVVMPDDVAARMRARLLAEVPQGAPGPEQLGASAAARPPSTTGTPSETCPPTRPGTPSGTGTPKGTGTPTSGIGAPGPGRGRTARRGATGVRRTPWRALAIAAAALVVAGVGASALAPTAPEVVPVAGTTPEELRSAAAAAPTPVGALDEPARVRACLAAAGDPRPDAPLLAVRPHTVDGGRAVLLVLGAPERGRYRHVVVPPDCRPGSARVLAETTTG
ncbi:hypothetical protein [Pseudonocardia sp. ICBG1293]|uniref:hypothetical protein n=1 Tax=Pseudonocardia sp. ICBG1293 TaxID=2844382 RepID=UPI001CC915BA|nr:hypothetical protein [Pseudonocardia sp. ICBG1293]